jgi:hypothetical protein
LVGAAAELAKGQSHRLPALVGTGRPQRLGEASPGSGHCPPRRPRATPDGPARSGRRASGRARGARVLAVRLAAAVDRPWGLAPEAGARAGALPTRAEVGRTRRTRRRRRGRSCSLRWAWVRPSWVFPGTTWLLGSGPVPPPCPTPPPPPACPPPCPPPGLAAGTSPCLAPGPPLPCGPRTQQTWRTAAGTGTGAAAKTPPRPATTPVCPAAGDPAGGPAVVVVVAAAGDQVAPTTTHPPPRGLPLAAGPRPLWAPLGPHPCPPPPGAPWPAGRCPLPWPPSGAWPHRTPRAGPSLRVGLCPHGAPGSVLRLAPRQGAPVRAGP